MNYDKLFLQDKQYVSDTIDGIDSYFSIDAGYITNSKLVVDSPEILRVESNMPELIKQLRYVDKNLNLIWYPSVLNTSYGMVFPDGTNASDWKWTVCKRIPLTEEQKEKIKNTNSIDYKFGSKLDMKNSIKFNPDQFREACIELGIYG